MSCDLCDLKINQKGISCQINDVQSKFGSIDDEHAKTLITHKEGEFF